MEEILNKVKKFLNINSDKEDAKLKTYIELFQNRVISICKRRDFPKELEYMCIDFVRKRYICYLNLDVDSNKKVEVTSASDNGQSVSFKTTEIVKIEDVDIDNYINKNIAEISNYAYMEWR